MGWIIFCSVDRGGTDLPTIDQNIEKLMFPGIFRCSFIYKTWDKSQFSSKLSFLPPYQGSENFDRFWWFYQLLGTGRKGKRWIRWPIIDFYQLIWHWYFPNMFQFPPRAFQTPSRHPQTPSRHPQTPSRHLSNNPKHKFKISYTREGYRYTKITFLQVFPPNPLLWSIIRHFI